MGSSYVRQVAPMATVASTGLSAAGTASTTPIAAGWAAGGLVFTPQYSGKVLVEMIGEGTTLTAIAYFYWQLYYGTAANAPAAGAALTNYSALGSLQQNRPQTLADYMSLGAGPQLITGLTPGTSYGIDLGYYTGTTGDHAEFQNCDVVIYELVN